MSGVMDWRSTLCAECQPTGLLSGHQDSSMESSPPARTSRPALFINPPAATTYTKITNNLGQKLVNKTTTFTNWPSKYWPKYVCWFDASWYQTLNLFAESWLQTLCFIWFVMLVLHGLTKICEISRRRQSSCCKQGNGLPLSLIHIWRCRRRG